MELVALLPMKAHSARVEGKNFREFNGKPLFAWILDTLHEVEDITQVIINTDARELLAKYGLQESGRVKIRDRSPELCGDEVSMNRILEDDIASVPADAYLMTHTTNPLLSAATIRSAIAEYRAAKQSGAADSLFSVTRMQTRFYTADAQAVNHDPDNLIPTQDLEPWFEENSNLYLFDSESFASTGARIGSKPMLFETPPLEAVDIDTPDDWEMALALAMHRERKEGADA